MPNVLDRTKLKYWHNPKDDSFFTTGLAEKPKVKGCVSLEKDEWERKKKRREMNPDGLFEVSQSKLKTYLRCQMAYRYKYVDKLRKRIKSRPLQFGTVVHELLEADANGDDWQDKLEEITQERGALFAKQVEEYGDILEDAYYILKDYFKHHGEDSLRYVRRKGRGAEHEFWLPVEGIMITGKIDAFAKTPNKLKWIVEHKTFKRLPNDDHRWRNLQSSLYIRVVETLGWFEPDGICWDYIRSSPPKLPQEIKTGYSSRGIDTLPSRLSDFIADNKLDPKQFEGLMKVATEGLSSSYPRIFAPVKRTVVDLVWEDFILAAKELEEFHGKKARRTIENHCDWCDYEPLCRAELTGSDVDFVKEREYYDGSKK